MQSGPTLPMTNDFLFTDSIDDEYDLHSSSFYEPLPPWAWHLKRTNYTNIRSHSYSLCFPSLSLSPLLSGDSVSFLKECLRARVLLPAVLQLLQQGRKGKPKKFNEMIIQLNIIVLFNNAQCGRRNTPSVSHYCRL